MKTFLNFRNNLTMLYKNLPEEELRHVMRMRWLLDYLAAFETLVFNRNIGDFKAIYMARHAFKKWLPEFKADRERIQAGRVEGRVNERVSYSILWQYYIKGKKTYSQLP